MNNILVLLPDSLIKPMGGMGEQARNLFDCFSDLFKFTVIGSSKSKEYHTSNLDYYPIMELSTINGNSDPFDSTYLNQSLFVEKALSLGIKYDLVHAFDWSAIWAGRVVSKSLNKPLIITMQLSIEKHIKTPHPAQVLQYQMACALEMSGLICSDAIIQVSESYAKLFPSFLLPKTTIINNGIELSKWNQKNKISLPGKNKFKLIYIGRYAEMKNVTSLLQAQLPKNIDLIFIGNKIGGSPEIFDLMIRTCEKHSNMFYVGPKYEQEKVDYLMAADAVIVPSVHEPFGIVALEALASKSILLSSFVNGMGDFLNENVALNCGTTPESISHALYVFSTMDEQTKIQMHHAGIELCKKMSWKSQADKLKTVYDNILYQYRNIR